jgi:hypothetical protein
MKFDKKMNKPFFVYISGPYSSDPVPNVENAIKTADIIRGYGFTPIIPHLCHFWNEICPHDYNYWIEYDLELLKICNALIRIPGESKGADIEIEFAKKENIPYFYTIDEFISKFSN